MDGHGDRRGRWLLHVLIVFQCEMYEGRRQGCAI